MNFFRLVSIEFVNTNKPTENSDYQLRTDNYLCNCSYYPCNILQLDVYGNVINGMIISPEYESEDFYYRGKSFKEHLLAIGMTEIDELN